MRRAAIKWTYLLVLIAGFIWFGNWLAAGYIYPQGEGIVIGEPAVVAAEFTATVKSIQVQQGQKVAQGDLVAQITSQSMAESRARLTSDSVGRSAKLAEMKIRNEIVNSTLSSAETRERVASEGQDRLNTLYNKGYSPNITRTEAAVQAYRGTQDAEALRAEQRSLTDQLRQLLKTSEAADSALFDLAVLFDNGQMRAPITGTISTVLVSPGSVIRVGDPMLEILGEHRFVISWFPVGRLFGSQGYDLVVGRAVSVYTGHSVLPGKIARVSTVAGPLPGEFKKSFAPTERQQFIRIEFDAGVVPPHTSPKSVSDSDFRGYGPGLSLKELLDPCGRYDGVMHSQKGSGRGSEQMACSLAEISTHAGAWRMHKGRSMFAVCTGTVCCCGIDRS